MRFRFCIALDALPLSLSAAIGSVGNELFAFSFDCSPSLSSYPSRACEDYARLRREEWRLRSVSGRAVFPEDRASPEHGYISRMDEYVLDVPVHITGPVVWSTSKEDSIQEAPQLEENHASSFRVQCDINHSESTVRLDIWASHIPALLRALASLSGRAQETDIVVDQTNTREISREKMDIDDVSMEEDKDAAFLFFQNDQISNDFVRAFSFAESTPFETVGVMIECSRNGVLRIESVCYLLRRCGLMGMNFAMLYTEDTFVVDGEPWFGYLRGAYSRDELTDLDQYAHMLGIEVIPCVQTLSHLSQPLQWPEMSRRLSDTENTLLCFRRHTYDVLELILSCASRPFRSRRIHVGLDEAANLSTGSMRYWLRTEEANEELGRLECSRLLSLSERALQEEAFSFHTRRVFDLCRKLGLYPLMWSDMLFRLGSMRNSYYDSDSEVSHMAALHLPRGMDLVYWDYYHTSSRFYDEWIQRHFEILAHSRVEYPSIGSGVPDSDHGNSYDSDIDSEEGSVWVATGAWAWGRFWTQLLHTAATSSACLRSCRRTHRREPPNRRIKHVIMTTWGDDGQESDPFSCLGSFAYFAHGAWCESAVQRPVPIAEDTFHCISSSIPAPSEEADMNSSTSCFIPHNLSAKEEVQCVPLSPVSEYGDVFSRYAEIRTFFRGCCHGANLDPILAASALDDFHLLDSSSQYRNDCPAWLSPSRWKNLTSQDRPYPDLDVVEEVSVLISGGPANPSKWLMWEDPFLLHLRPQLAGLDTLLAAHYRVLAERLQAMQIESVSIVGDRFHIQHRMVLPLLIARVLSRKLRIPVEMESILSSWPSHEAESFLDSNDPCHFTLSLWLSSRDVLLDIQRRWLIPLMEDLCELNCEHRAMWNVTFKPFGLEALEIRYGGQRSRFESLSDSVTDLISACASVIESCHPASDAVETPDAESDDCRILIAEGVRAYQSLSSVYRDPIRLPAYDVRPSRGSDSSVSVSLPYLEYARAATTSAAAF